MQHANINFDNLPSSISEFFTPEQFAEISDYEKQLFSNLRQHFEALRRFGLPVAPPEFMLRNRSERERRKLVTPAVIESSDGSDSEWTPALEKPKRPSVNQRKRFFEPPKKTSSKDNTKDKVAGPTKRKKQVYYGNSYAKDLGIESPKFGKKLQRTIDLQKSDVNTNNDGVFSCTHCSLSFHQSWFLQRHMKYRHHNEYLELNHDKLHPDLSLGVNDLTKVHIRHEQHDVNFLLNDTDIKMTASTQSESEKTNNPNNIFTVDVTKTSGVQTHTRIHTGEKPYKCDVCNVRFIQHCNLKTHKRIHTGEKPYKCDVCSVGFSKSGNLKTHKRIHTGEKPYKCDVCNVGFSESGSLKKHKRIHTREKPYKCDVCNVGFSESGSLMKHKRIHTREKPYKCEVCNVGFTQSGYLKTHKRIHTGEKPYKCDVCSVGFSKSGNLKTHKRIHTGEKPYKCDVCSVGFSKSGNLKTHKRIHTGEKPYKCDVCSVGFSKSGNLKTHKRIHTGGKPYKCEVCNVGFTQSGYLKTHKRIHTGEKPYKCDVCNVCFSENVYLKRHKRIHTGEKSYKCDVCNVGFSERGHLKRHKRIHTGEAVQV